MSTPWLIVRSKAVMMEHIFPGLANGSAVLQVRCNNIHLMLITVFFASADHYFCHHLNECVRARCSPAQWIRNAPKEGICNAMHAYYSYATIPLESLLHICKRNFLSGYAINTH